MKQIAFTVLIFTIISKSTIGQKTFYGFQEGTITKKDSSLIKGYVEFAISYNSRVEYKITKDGNVHSLKSSEIKSIQTPYNYIENITLDYNERLMTITVDGNVKLFNHITSHQGRTAPGPHGGTYNIDAPPTIIYALKKDENFTEIKKKDFKSTLAALLSDQPSIVERINNNEFKFEDIEKLIKQYNDIYKIETLKRQITAKVVDSETKKPVKDAKVTIQGTNIETTTNFLGFIQITIDTIDTLLIDHPEYEMGLVKVPDVNSFQINLIKTLIKKEK